MLCNVKGCRLVEALKAELDRNHRHHRHHRHLSACLRFQLKFVQFPGINLPQAPVACVVIVSGFRSKEWKEKVVKCCTLLPLAHFLWHIGVQNSTLLCGRDCDLDGSAWKSVESCAFNVICLKQRQYASVPSTHTGFLCQHLVNGSVPEKIQTVL